MNIPSHLPRFEEERAILVSTGKQVGKIYYASKGKVTEVASLNIETPKYSDREGFFASSGNGKTYGSGSVFEPKDQETKKKFQREFKEEIKKIISKKKIDEIYLFSPNYAMKELKEELPREVAKKIRFSFMGNFVKFGPFELLRQISEKIEKMKAVNQHRNDEELKILSKPKENPSKAKRQLGLKFA